MSQRDISRPSPGADARPSPPASQPGKGEERAPLSRSLKLLETVALTVAAVAPTAGVFIIVPVALVATGTGTFCIFLLGAAIAVCVGYCYAELGVVMTQQTRGNLEITGWILLGSLVYFVLFCGASAPAAGRWTTLPRKARSNGGLTFASVRPL
jgi:hypothetical protein